MSMPTFDADIPFDCLSATLTIIRSGNVATQKLQLIQNLSWIAGCVSKKLEGSKPVFAAPEYIPFTIDGVCGRLDEVIAFSGPTAPTIDYAELLALVMRLAQLFLR